METLPTWSHWMWRGWPVCFKGIWLFAISCTCLDSGNMRIFRKSYQAKITPIVELMQSKGYFIYGDTYVNTIFVNKEWFYKDFQTNWCYCFVTGGREERLRHRLIEQENNYFTHGQERWDPYPFRWAPPCLFSNYYSIIWCFIKRFPCNYPCWKGKGFIEQALTGYNVIYYQTKRKNQPLYINPGIFCCHW